MDVIEGTGSIVPEPDWDLLFSDVLEVQAAKEHWRVITTELKERQLLAAANSHSIQRLVCAYLMFDRMYRHVAENGVVSKPKRGNPKAIARITPHYTAMREAGSDATALEAELGITPRRRGSAGKVAQRKRKERASDAQARVGDLAVVLEPEGEHVAVCMGRDFVVKTEHGRRDFGVTDCLAAFQVG